MFEKFVSNFVNLASKAHSTTDPSKRSFFRLVQKYFLNKTFIKYLISGGSAAALMFVLLYAFTEYLHIWYLFSSVLATIVQIVINFCLQKFWAFRGDHAKQTHHQFMMFIGLNVFNLAVNATGMYLLVDLVRLWYMLAQFLMAVVLAAESYILYHLVLFKKEETRTQIYEQ